MRRRALPLLAVPVLAALAALGSPTAQTGGRPADRADAAVLAARSSRAPRASRSRPFAALLPEARRPDPPEPRPEFRLAPAVTTTTTAPPPPPPTTTTTARPRPATATTAAARPAPAPEAAYGSSIPRNATEACIVRREHGGSYSRGSNPTHFGRYQFSRASWAAHGGDPDTWGSASPEEQDRVFVQAVEDDGGYSEWTPYDGC
jgi:hypothetical protein